MSRLFHLRAARVAACAALLTLAGTASAQFDPAKVVVEPAPIAAQFPDPAATFDTPAFTGDRRDFTSHAEMAAFVEKLRRGSGRVEIETMGRSQEGRAMLLLVISGKAGFDPSLPTVMLLGQQHGNEPAGGEAALAVARQLAVVRSDLLERVNVLVIPRGNPDAAEHFARVSTDGTDVNRDHLLLRTPEVQAIAATVRRYRPQVMLDMHEFTVAGRWVDKFGSFMRYDALLQAANTGNLNPEVHRLQARYLSAARTAIEARGQRVSDYFTTSSDAHQKAVSMGGVNVDTGRNVGGLRNAVSILLETRGVGLGRAHLARRVEAHVAAAMGVIELAAQDGFGLVASTRDAGTATAAQACRGDMAVAVRQTPERRTLQFLNAGTGEPREIEVDWRSSTTLQTTSWRNRPCGYLIDAGQKSAVDRLLTLGVAANVVVNPDKTHAWSTEAYEILTDASGQRQDARGAIEDGQGIRVLTVKTMHSDLAPRAGSYFISMDQPLAGLVSAALEPDSQNSFAANRLIEIDRQQLRRVGIPPDPGSFLPYRP